MTKSRVTKFRIERDTNPHSLRNALARNTDRDDCDSHASAYRLRQAENLLTDAGYVRRDDGTWVLPEDT